MVILHVHKYEKKSN